MDQDYSEMESRLNDVLSRIAMETQEIKELEQQLTDGQILANEALKRDLEGVISGLQQYLKSLTAQTNKAQVNTQSLQAENQSVRRHLRDTQRHYRRLDEQATAHTQLMAAQQDDLSMLHSEAASLRDAQVHMEAELQHLRAELDRQVGQSDQCLLQQTICDLQTRLERFASGIPDHSSSLRVEDLSRSKSQALDQSLSEGRHRNLHRLNRKLQGLRRIMCETESLTGEQLLWAVHQVKELNRSVDRLKGRLEDGEAQSEHTEDQAQVDRARTKTRTKARCKAGAETELRTRPDRDEAPRSRAPARLTTVSVGSGATLDSGLDLHLLSSPERAPTTGPAGNWHYRTRTEEQHQHHQHHQHHHHQHLTETDPSEEGGSTEAEPAGGAHTQDEKKRLRVETEKLQRALRKHRRVLGVCEEVWCVEQTLMKRRAELREAQRLLQEAHSSTAKARHEAEEWARRAKDSATCLQRTQLQLRELQDAAEARVQILDWRDLIQSLDSENQQGSLRIQEEKLQQRIQELRSQESRVKSTLEALEQQQEALLSQKSSVDPAAAEEEQRLERLRTELDSARIELKQVLEEVLLERQELVRLKTLRSQHFTKPQETQNQLDQTRDQLDQAKDQLDQTRDQLDQAKDQLNQTRDQLDQTKDQLDQTRDEAEQALEETRRKEEELNEKQKELDQSQAAADRKRAELTALEQEVEMLREEAESRLKEKERQQKELQALKEEVERTTEQSSSLQQQCRHLEDRRRHAHRCLSAVEAELERLGQEQSQSLLTQQEVKKETAANQDKLNESTELLCFLGEKLEEKKVQLQTLQQELSALREKQQQKQTELDQSRELQEENRLNHREMSAAGTEREDRGRCVARESEELREREERLLRREAGLQLKEEGLKQKEELRQSGAEFKEEEEELKSDLEDSDGASSEDFYLSTAGLRSASSPEEQMWRVELETDKLKFEEDSLKARLRSSLQTRRHRLQERGLEAEQSVRGLRKRVERLDSLLLRAETQE